MRKDLLEIVCCPVHKSPLVAAVTRQDEAGDILEGTLTCKECRFAYPIEEGIPNLLPPEYHVDQVREPAPKPARASGKAKAAK
ncbi:MAG TPA: methytransferase partner Trm112 [Candidatus Thermoplasmatota archaeon]|nr:methytransferase partner Trm112 [Candidatus Thermoplasmatota archaeon]